MKTVPPQHNRKAPRGWLELFWAKGGFLAAIAAVALLILTVLSVNNYRTAATFDRIGQGIPAQITSKWVSRGDESDDYYVRFEYVVGGQVYTTARKVARRYYVGVNVGDQREIRVLPNRPERMEYYLGETRDKARLTQMIAGGLGGVALILLWIYGARVNRAVLARKYGYRSVAEVMSIVERKNSGKPTGRGYMIWNTDEGLRGESLDRPISDLHQIGRGAKINVFVRKGQSYWEGDVGPRTDPDSRIPKVPRDRT